MCWIAFGYDPRSSRDSRIYQVTRSRRTAHGGCCVFLVASPVSNTLTLCQVLDLRLPPGVEHLVPKKTEKRLLGTPARIPARRSADAASGAVSTGIGTGTGTGPGAGVALNGASASSAIRSGCSVVAASSSQMGEADFFEHRVPGDQALPSQRHVYFQMCDFTGERLVALVHEEEVSTPLEPRPRPSRIHTVEYLRPNDARLCRMGCLPAVTRRLVGTQPRRSTDCVSC